MLFLYRVTERCDRLTVPLPCTASEKVVFKVVLVKVESNSKKEVPTERSLSGALAGVVFTRLHIIINSDSAVSICNLIGSRLSRVLEQNVCPLSFTVLSISIVHRRLSVTCRWYRCVCSILHGHLLLMLRLSLPWKWRRVEVVQMPR